MQANIPAIVEQEASRILKEYHGLGRDKFCQLLNDLSTRLGFESYERGPIDPETLHVWGCGCDHCRTINQVAF